MDNARLRHLILSHAVKWGSLEAVVDSFLAPKAFPIWSYAECACLAVGGTPQQAEAVVAALCCSVASISVADDILDEDPAGQHHKLGVGRAANLALALQALGLRILCTQAVDSELLAKQCASYSLSSLSTAHGQELDVLGGANEDDYWNIIAAKTPPLLVSAFEMGALAGRANQTVVEGFKALGKTFGLLIQLSDDLADALAAPATEDWRRPTSNLALLYASTVAHDDQDAFLSLLPGVADREQLTQAQQILARSGAISYCASKMLEQVCVLKKTLAQIELVEREPIRQLISQFIETLRFLFEAGGDAEALDLALVPHDRH